MGFFRIKKNKDKISNSEGELFDLTCNALREVMPEHSKQTKLTENTNINSLGIDSIKYLNLLISFEDIIGKNLEDIVEQIDITKLNTIKDLVELLKIHKS